jgi:signal transduction histidine kinase
LSIVRHVAQAHGGEVTVESVEGEGSTFVLHLPVVQRPSSIELGDEERTEARRRARARGLSEAS